MYKNKCKNTQLPALAIGQHAQTGHGLFCYLCGIMNFTIEHADTLTSARAGKIETAHGTIETPVFMPVGTAGTVKAVHFRELEHDIGAQIILGNTYHLFLRPGTHVLSEAGGLHRFIGWDGPVLTDSGGYQVFSLAVSRKIMPNGVKFQSHIDGSSHVFTPENVMDTQRIIGGDIIMAFDECTPYPCERTYAEKSLELTHRWLKQCVQHFKETEPHYGFEQSLFPIVQGSTYPDLRRQSAEFVASMGMDGNAIGGLSVGEPAEEMYAMASLVCSILPQDKPRYLMGVGTPANILENISLGVDMFDCVMPTRNGRNGMLFTSKGIINIRNEKWKNDFSSLDEDNHTFVDVKHTKAYLRHLFISGEMLGASIASIHNLGFYMWLVREARKHIIAGTYGTWKDRMKKDVDARL
jgi:queuine tRNA-ribosyltransferase